MISCYCYPCQCFSKFLYHRLCYINKTYAVHFEKSNLVISEFQKMYILCTIRIVCTIEMIQLLDYILNIVFFLQCSGKITKIFIKALKLKTFIIFEVITFKECLKCNWIMQPNRGKQNPLMFSWHLYTSYFDYLMALNISEQNKIKSMCDKAIESKPILKHRLNFYWQSSDHIIEQCATSQEPHIERITEISKVIPVWLKSNLK